MQHLLCKQTLLLGRLRLHQFDYCLLLRFHRISMSLCTLTGVEDEEWEKGLDQKKIWEEKRE